MIPFEEIRPHEVDDVVGEVVIRFIQSDGIPIVDDQGSYKLQGGKTVLPMLYLFYWRQTIQ